MNEYSSIVFCKKIVIFKRLGASIAKGIKLGTHPFGDGRGRKISSPDRETIYKGGRPPSDHAQPL